MSRQSRIDTTENVKLTRLTAATPVTRGVPASLPPPLRGSVEVDVELRLRGGSFPGRIHRLSRFGAFVQCGFAFRAGDVVSIVLVHPACVSTRALVIHHISDADAERLGAVTGVGLRFRDPVNESDAAFARTICALLTTVATTQTRRMIKPIENTLLRATRDAEASDDKLVFAGHLQEVHLRDLLEMVLASRKSRRVVLVRGDVTICIEIVDGQLVEASCGDPQSSPLDIISAALDWSTGTFEVRTSSRRGPCAALDTSVLRRGL